MPSFLDKKHIIANALLFQLCWFSAILTQWYIALVPLIIMSVHILYLQDKTRISIKLLIALSSIGILMDSTLAYIGVYQFEASTAFIPYLQFPVWLAILWLSFCLTLSVSLEWLIKKPVVFILACSVMGPVSYLAGRRFEVVSFADSNLWILSLEWFLFSLIAALVLFPKLGEGKFSTIFMKKGSLC